MREPIINDWMKPGAMVPVDLASVGILMFEVNRQDAEIERLRKEATACVASIRTRTGQIEKAQANYTANSFYQIDAAVHQIKQAADDLRRALDHGIVRAALEQKAAPDVTDVGPAAGEPVTGWIDPDAPHR